MRLRLWARSPAVRVPLVTLAFLVLSAGGSAGDAEGFDANRAAQGTTGELRRYGTDAIRLIQAPLTWDRVAWSRAAALSVGLGVLVLADEEVIAAFRRNRSAGTHAIADVVTPWGDKRPLNLSVALIALGFAFDTPHLRDTGRDALEAVLFAGRGITPLVKNAAGRTRPCEDGDAWVFSPYSGHRSFPSGHTTNAFAVASVIAARSSGKFVPIVAYGLATAVGVARIHDELHFASDVAAGAIVGTLVGHHVVKLNRRSPEPDQETSSETAWLMTPLVEPGRVGIAFRF